IEKANKTNKLNKNFVQYDPKTIHPQAIYPSRYLLFLKPKKAEHNFEILED
ncbi:19388_t:CDS:2, partial [Dentiscutata erythropus]